MDEMGWGFCVNYTSIICPFPSQRWSNSIGPTAGPPPPSSLSWRGRRGSASKQASRSLLFSAYSSTPKQRHRGHAACPTLKIQRKETPWPRARRSPTETTQEDTITHCSKADIAAARQGLLHDRSRRIKLLSPLAESLCGRKDDGERRGGS